MGWYIKEKWYPTVTKKAQDMNWKDNQIKKLSEHLILMEEINNNTHYSYYIVEVDDTGKHLRTITRTRTNQTNPERWAKRAIIDSAKRTLAHAQKVRKILFEIETKLSKLIDAQTEIEYLETLPKKT